MFFNFLEKLSLAGSDLVDCRYPRRDRKGDCGNVDDRAIKTIALNCPRLKYIDLYKGKLNLNYFSKIFRSYLPLYRSMYLSLGQFKAIVLITISSTLPMSPFLSRLG